MFVTTIRMMSTMSTYKSIPIYVGGVVLPGLFEDNVSLESLPKVCHSGIVKDNNG